MFSQGSYNTQFGQGPQTPRAPLFLQQPPALPPLPHNFQQGPPLPSPQVLPRPGQPGLPIYQHGPVAPHLAVRQGPLRLPTGGQPYLPPPPTVPGQLPHVYTTIQHSSYLAPGLPPPPPPGAPMHQLPRQPVGLQSLQQVPPPPPLPPTYSSFALSGSTSAETVGNSQMASTVLPPTPPPPPLPPSPPPIPPSSPPPVFSSSSVSMPLPAGSDISHVSNLADSNKLLNQTAHNIPVRNLSVGDGSLLLEGRSGSDVNCPGKDVSSLKKIAASDDPCPPKPKEERIVQKIEDFCQLIAKNGYSYEEMARLKEYENPEFKFLFGGEPESEAAIAHEYFLWKKKQSLLACESDRIQPAMSTNRSMVTTEPHSPADSDMEMEDDITRSDVDQAVNLPTESSTQATDPVSSEFDKKKQLNALVSSAGSDAATMFLSERLGEEGSKLASSHGDLTFGRSVFRVQSPVINSTVATEYPFSSDRVKSSTFLIDDNSSSKAAAAAECINSDSYSGQVIKGSSPFRHLQDNASNDSSENDDDPSLKDVNPETVSRLVAVGTENLHRDTRIDLEGDTGSRSLCKTEGGFGQLSEPGISCKASDFSSYSQRQVKETVSLSTAGGSSTKLTDTKYENQLSINNAASQKIIPKEDASASGGVQENVSFSGKYEDNADNVAKSTSNIQKIDRFGRLVREGATDSDSDDSHHAYRRSKRGRSRSHSPLDRRRRRRNLTRRRREKRSRSRSWSPRNQRSRSRSPSFKQAGEFSSVNGRREKGHLQECFDFLRGRCYRGAFCRYMHHDSEKNDGPKHRRSKQQEVQLPPSSKNYNTREGNKNLSLNVSDHGQEWMNQEMQNNQDKPASSICATKDNTVVNSKEDSVCDALVDSEIIKADSFRVFVAEVPKTRAVEERSEDGKSCRYENFQEAMESDQPMVVDIFPSKPESDYNIFKSHGEASQDVISSLKNSVIQQSRSFQSDPALEGADYHVQQTDDSSISNTSPDETSSTSPKNIHISETVPNSADSLNNPSQQSPFHLYAPNSDGKDAPHMAQLSMDYSLMLQSAAFQSQSAPLENFSYMLPKQNSCFSLPSNTSSATLPMPPPLLLPAHGAAGNAVAAPANVNLQFQQSCFGSQIQVGEFQHRAYPPPQESHQPLLHLDDFRLKPLPGCNSSSQQIGGSALFGEDCLKQPSLQATSVLDSSSQSNNYPQPMPFLQDGSATKQSLPRDNLPPEDILKSYSRSDPYSQPRQAPYNFHHSVPEGVYRLPGNNISSSIYRPDLQDRNPPSHSLVSGLWRNSTHFNPYASTFEKPLSSRFSSGIFRQEKDTMYGGIHDRPLGMSHVSLDQQGVGSREATSPTSATGVRKIIPMSGGESGDQYDPLFDSIEPSSKSYKASDHIQKGEPSGDSGIVLRHKCSNQLLDVEENNKKKEVGGIMLATSIDNEEFGETADLEVGDIGDGSQNNPNALTNMNMGEMEIDQLSPRKSKDSRSMKLFKACLAHFVKEVLKPSWRQGNMSKETFKTVVKKTVDKVSEAMKSRRIPKSKAKINQYIDSSQQKLTKLVMGYVDKYAKG